jgi:hypothetical protein
MQRQTYNDGGDRDLVFVLGWGNSPDMETVQWLVDHLVEADYRTHVFQIPTVISDFETEYLAPVADFTEELGEYRLLTHSTGGLIGEFLADPAPETKVHLGPWWGFHADLENPLVDLTMWLGVPWSVLPAGIDREDLGVHATERQIEATPSRAAPTFLREAKRAQERLPPFDDHAVVFYTPTDPVVGVEAIEARTPPENRVAYEGGHELFGSASREDHVETVLAALEEGADAL